MDVRIQVKGQDRQMFHSLLREGVDVEVRLGRSVREILKDDLHVPEQIIEKDIQSLFLNNHPVDDLRIPVQESGSVLSLSAAMPGLVGACMRRGGTYSGLRQGISWSENEAEQLRQEKGCLRVKLFNFMAPALGPLFLSRGVQVEGSRLAQIMKGLTETERDRIVGLYVNDSKAQIQDPELIDRISAQETVSLFVSTLF
jgi:hypothetical protein